MRWGCLSLPICPPPERKAARFSVWPMAFILKSDRTFRKRQKLFKRRALTTKGLGLIADVEMTVRRVGHPKFPAHVPFSVAPHYFAG